MNKVLVTGGTGFIGSNLSIYLKNQGIDVRVLRRVNSDLRALEGTTFVFFYGDVLDEGSLRRAFESCNTVIHTAALVTFSRKRREEQFQINVIGTRNVVNACLATGIQRLLHVSSVAAIGHPAEGDIATEETPYNWGQTSGYKYSKHRAELEIQKGIERGLHAVMVNPSVVVGERDIHFHGGQIIRDIKRGRIPFYVDGGMNIVHVQDVVHGIVSALEKGRNGERYILAGENLTHKEIFNRTAALIDGRKPFGRLPTSLLVPASTLMERASTLFGFEPLITKELAIGATRQNWYSSDKARKELGFNPASFDRAILDAYQWYRARGML